MGERFWLEDPRLLVSNLRFLPGEDLTVHENLNAVTRLILLVSIVLAIAGWKHWLTFLLIAVVLIIFVYLSKLEDQKSSIEHFNEDMDNFEFYKDKAVIQTDHSESDLKDVPLRKLFIELLAPLADEEPVDADSMDGVTFIPDSGKKEKTAEQHMRDFYDDEDEYDPTDFTRKAMFHAIL